MKKSIKKSSSKKFLAKSRISSLTPSHDPISTVIGVVAVVIIVWGGVFIFSKMRVGQPVGINQVGNTPRRSTAPVVKNIITVSGTISTSKERQIVENEQGNGGQGAGFRVMTYWLTASDGTRYLLKPKYTALRVGANNVSKFVGKRVEITGNQGSQAVQRIIAPQVQGELSQGNTRVVPTQQLTLTVDTITAMPL